MNPREEIIIELDMLYPSPSCDSFTSQQVRHAVSSKLWFPHLPKGGDAISSKLLFLHLPTGEACCILQAVIPSPPNRWGMLYAPPSCVPPNRLGMLYPSLSCDSFTSQQVGDVVSFSKLWFPHLPNRWGMLYPPSCDSFTSQQVGDAVSSKLWFLHLPTGGGCCILLQSVIPLPPNRWGMLYPNSYTPCDELIMTFVSRSWSLATQLDNCLAHVLDMWLSATLPCCEHKHDLRTWIHKAM